MAAQASLSGVLPTMWCAMRGWAKDEKRAVLQIFNITILGVTAASLALTSQSVRDAGWLVSSLTTYQPYCCPSRDEAV